MRPAECWPSGWAGFGGWEQGRVLAYLNAVVLQTGSRSFDIPFDRQQLADYLNLDRSALSKELGRMQREGILTVKKNHFLLHAAEGAF